MIASHSPSDNPAPQSIDETLVPSTDRIVNTPVPFLEETLVPSGEAGDSVRIEKYPEIPGYEIQGELGRGGMGVVYKARQIALNRLVALRSYP